MRSVVLHPRCHPGVLARRVGELHATRRRAVLLRSSGSDCTTGSVGAIPDSGEERALDDRAPRPATRSPTSRGRRSRRSGACSSMLNPVNTDESFHGIVAGALGGAGLAGDRDRLDRVVVEQILAGRLVVEVRLDAAAPGVTTRRRPSTIGRRTSRRASRSGGSSSGVPNDLVDRALGEVDHARLAVGHTRVPDRLHDLGSEHEAPIGDRRVAGRQLHRGRRQQALPDRQLDVVAGEVAASFVLADDAELGVTRA